jgi:hypothetical protein
MLRPFWRYYGGKWRAAPRYPAPRYDTIIEPFAGRSRRGQVIVCEAEGATWLPFRPFGETCGVSGKRSREAVWLSDEAQLAPPMEAA